MRLNLHLGCGNIRLPGWVNIDARDHPAVDKVADIAGLTPTMLPEPAAAVYACHVLEHFGFGCVRPTALDVLISWVALLAPGGEVFLSVPDLERIGPALARCKTFAEQFNFMRAIYGGSEYPQNRHFIGFTPILLTDFMLRAGLEDIVPFESFADDTSRFQISGVPISLNLKGRKPQ